MGLLYLYLYLYLYLNVKCRYSSQILMKVKFLDRFSKNPQKNFMKIHPLRAELFHADGRTETDRHDKADNRISQFCESA